MKKVLDKIKNKKVLIIGDIMLDSYVYGDVNRISPEAPVPILHNKKEEHKLGGAANVALNIKTLEATPTILSIIGKDVAGEKIKKLLEENNIINFLIETLKPTTEKKRLISGNTHLLRIDTEDTSYIDTQTESSLYYIAEKEILKNDVIIFSDYNKGVLTEKLIKFIIDFSKENNKVIIVDPKIKNFFSYKGVDVFKPNLKELNESFNNKDSNYKDVSKILKNLINADNIMITLSENGIYMLGDSEIESPSIGIEIADPCGAGDTVAAVLSLFYNEVDNETLLKLCNIAGSMVCEHVGVVQIKLEDLMNNFWNS